MIERLRQLMKETHINQRQLAEMLGITSSTASTIVNGKSGLTDRNIDILAEKLNVNKVWLKTGVGEMFAEETLEAKIQRMMIGATDQQKRIVAKLMEAPDEVWEAADKVIDWLIETKYGEK